jgi:hypothetical protein
MIGPNVGWWGKYTQIYELILMGERGRDVWTSCNVYHFLKKEDIFKKQYQRRNPTQNPTLLFTTRLTARNHQFRHLIRSIQHLLLVRHLARRTAVARRDIQGRVAREEIPRSEEQGHGFCRHDGEVFRGGEMRDAERVPEDDVGVVD